MIKSGSQRERSMTKFSIYLHRHCARAKQEGVIWMTNPSNSNKERHFDYLDAIPSKIREHLKMIGWAYDVADDSDETVSAPKTNKSKAVQKIRLKDLCRVPRPLPVLQRAGAGGGIKLFSSSSRRAATG